MKFKSYIRGRDNYGSGAYGASRGDRTHQGIDFVAAPGMIALSTCDGIVSKLGYPYANHLEYRYVQITTSNNKDHRYFYVEPTVKVGESIKKGDPIGIVQDLSIIYPNGMTNHVHFEVKEKGVYLDPRDYL